MADILIRRMNVPKNCEECSKDLAVAVKCVYTQRLVLPSEHDIRLGRHPDCPLTPFTQQEPKITTNMYDQEEIHHNCTVQVLRNSVTGDVHVGWWEEKMEE